MQLRRFSAIARPVDLRYPTNRAIAALTLVVIVCECARHLLIGVNWVTSVRLGVGLGLAVFLAWAICREIDPDRDLSAFVAAGLAIVGTVVWGLSGYGVLFWLLLSVRVVNRTTGLPATVLDSLGVLSLAVWLSFRVLWPLGVISAFAFLLDGMMAQPNRRHLVFGIFSIVVAAAAGVSGGVFWVGSRSTLTSCSAAIVLCLFFLPVIRAAGRPQTLADDTQQPLDSWRVRAGQMFALLVGVVAAFWDGADGLVLALPLWAAVVGASAFLLIKSVVK